MRTLFEHVVMSCIDAGLVGGQSFGVDASLIQAYANTKQTAIVDVEASCAINQAEVGAARTMIERSEERFGMKPGLISGDTACGTAPMLA